MLEHDKEIVDLALKTIKEFLTGKAYQKWEMISKNSVIKTWRDFSRTGQVSKEDIFEIYHQALDLLQQLLANSLINNYTWRTKQGYTFNENTAKKEGLKFIDNEKFSKFIRDYWTEDDDTFEKDYNKLKRASTPSEQLIAVDQLFNRVHGMGSIAKWFIDGGDVTLNLLYNKPRLSSICALLKKIAKSI